MCLLGHEKQDYMLFDLICSVDFSCDTLFTVKPYLLTYSLLGGALITVKKYYASLW